MAIWKCRLIRGATLLPVLKSLHREQVEEVVQKVLEKESREKQPVIVVKKDGINYQLKCEDIRYLEAIPERNKTASCDGELGCPLCDSQTDAA